MSRPTTYVSLDVETNGPAPGLHSMLSFGVAAFLEDGTMVDTFTRNLFEDTGAGRDEDTMRWWAKQPDAWAKVQENRVYPRDAIHDFLTWMAKIQNPVIVAYPSGFDFTFLYWYCVKYSRVSGSGIGFSCIDAKTYAFAILGGSFRDASKKNFPKAWFPPHVKHTHVALEDAIEQGQLFINMLKEARGIRRAAGLDR